MGFDFSPRRFFSPAVYYPAGCDVALPDHACSVCPDIESAKIRSVAFIKKTFAFTDPTDPTEWEAGVASKDIRIIPAVIGSYNGGEPVEGAGYGDQSTRLTGYNFEMTYKDPNYLDNAGFYNAFKYNNEYRVAFRTETLTHMSDSTVSVIPKNPISESDSDAVVWELTVKFAQKDIPAPFLTPPDIFRCFAYEAAT